MDSVLSSFKAPLPVAPARATSPELTRQATAAPKPGAQLRPGGARQEGTGPEGPEGTGQSRVISDGDARDGGLDEARDEALFEAAQKLEVSFVTQLLQYSGFTKGLETHIGGAGSGQGASAFSSIYINDIAEKIVEGGGIGLADTFYQNLLTSGADHASDE